VFTMIGAHDCKLRRWMVVTWKRVLQSVAVMVTIMLGSGAVIAYFTRGESRGTSELHIDFEGGLPSGVEGNATLVKEPTHSGQFALRVGFKGMAKISVSSKPVYGTVRIWFYDSGTTLENERQYAIGPLIGLMDADGKVVVYGRLYAPYLAGNRGYGYINTVTRSWYDRMWAGGTVKQGWHEWTFSVAPDGEMQVLLDGRAVHAEMAEMPNGFTHIVIYGSRENFPDAAIVDDITVIIEGEVKLGVIERKPLPGKFEIPFRKELLGKHPRLFFTEEELPMLRERIKSTHKQFFDGALKYAQTALTPPKDERWLTDGTEAQRWGWWRMVTVAFVAALTDEPRYKEATKQLLLTFCRSRHFEIGQERDSGMGAANILAGVAIGYDVAYNWLSEQERKLVQDKLWLQVHRMYELGFMQKGSGPHYWQQDPQNNHLFHRLAGLLLASLALYGDIAEIDGYLDYGIRKAQEVVKWLPPDGSNHESVGYQAFGTQYLIPTLWALRRCTHVDLLTGQECIRQMAHFRAHMVLPTRKHVWDYGDGGRGVGWFNHYHFLIASLFRDSYAQALHLRNYEAAPESYDYQCWLILFYDPTLKPADLSTYPTWRYFPDLEVATFRSSWDDANALAAFFKCGPYGGHTLCRYRESAEKPRYVNVAHDHPDAGHFMIFWRGEFFAMDAGYAHDRKLTADHNTILVNGKGQAGEGLGWTQPISSMGDRARITEFFGAPGYGMVRGNAGRFYDGLKQFERTFVYLDDAHILICDRISAVKPCTIDWLYHCDGEWKEVGKGAYEITKGNAKLRAAILYPDGGQFEVAEHVADGGRGEKKKRLLARWESWLDGFIIAHMSPQWENPVACIGVEQLANGFAINFKRGNAEELFLLRTAEGTITTRGIATDAELCSIRTAKNEGALMLIRATQWKGNGIGISLSRHGNLLVRWNDAEVRLHITSPLGEETNDVHIAIALNKVEQRKRFEVNGQPITPTLRDGQLLIHMRMPRWSEILP